jgi:hypothetical protein
MAQSSQRVQSKVNEKPKKDIKWKGDVGFLGCEPKNRNLYIHCRENIRIS